MFRIAGAVSAVILIAYLGYRWSRRAEPTPSIQAVVETVAPHEIPPLAPQPRTPMTAPRYTNSPGAKAPAAQPAPSHQSPAERVAQLKQKLAKDPENAQLLFELGETLAKDLHAPQEAIPHLEKSVKLDSSNGVALFDLVGAYLESSNVERGAAFLEQLIKSDSPDKATAYAALGDLRASSGDPLGALPAMVKAHEAEPDSPTYTARLADTQQQTGDVRAEETMKLAISQQSALIRQLTAQGAPVENERRQLFEMMRSQVDQMYSNGRVDELERMLSTAPEALKGHIQELLSRKDG